MRDIFFTILIIWVLFQIFGRRRPLFQVFNHTHKDRFNGAGEEAGNSRGDIKINTKASKGKSKGDEGEYVDYEEVK